MVETNASTSQYTGIVPISFLSFIDIPRYLLMNDSRVNQYELYLAIQDFSFKENNDLVFKKGTYNDINIFFFKVDSGTLFLFKKVNYL
jgi:hypothetical protein